MAQLINLKTITDTRGSLTVIERVIPFEIKRIFYANGPDYAGGEGVEQAVICLKGSCHISSHAGSGEQHFRLATADQCLLLSPQDRHRLLETSQGAILMVLSSGAFEQEAQVLEPSLCGLLVD